MLAFEEAPTILALGRNFQNTTTLTCRFRNCVSSVQLFEREARELPGACNNNNDNSASSLSHAYFDTYGKFISTTRVLCPVRALLSEENKFFDFSSSDICGVDSSGSYFYFQICTNEDILTGICNERGLKRVYSLILDCTDDERISKTCQNTPAFGLRLGIALMNK